MAHHDLDHLAGTWSDDDAKAFKENTRDFEQIDEEMWECTAQKGRQTGDTTGSGGPRS